MTNETQIDRFFRRNLRLSHLRTLSAMAKLGQVRKVAEAFNVTQSAVSKQLAEIEDGLGEPLLRRHGKGLEFTPVGAKLAARATDLLGQLDHVRLEVAALSTGLSGRVRIGAVTTVNSTLIPRAICMLRKCSRDGDVMLEENTADRLLRNLQEGLLDIVVCRIWHQISVEGLLQSVLMHESVVLVVGAQHPLAKKCNVSWDDLTKFPWIVPIAGSPARNALEALAAKHGVRIPHGRVESISLTLNLTLFEMDHYIGLLPKGYALRLEQAGSLRVLPLDTENLLSETRMFWRNDDREPMTKQLLECLEEAAKVMEG